MTALWDSTLGFDPGRTSQKITRDILSITVQIKSGKSKTKGEKNMFSFIGSCIVIVGFAAWLNSVL